MWKIYNTRVAKGESIRVFPISNWTELDIWRFVEEYDIALPSIYFAHRRRVFRRDGMWMAETPFLSADADEPVTEQTVRFRTVGDITCTCPVESTAATPEDIVIETLAADISERGATRMDDQTSDASMEKRKKEGYF